MTAQVATDTGWAHRLLAGIRAVYDATLRPRLPARLGAYQSVAVRKRPWLDRSHATTHEASLCTAIKQAVQPGDEVVLLGTGTGVSTVHASVMAGQEGHVSAYDASEEAVKQTAGTLEFNLTPSGVDLHHAVIGAVSSFSRRRFGAPRDAETLEPTALPESDVLIMDIEGAERAVLDALTTSPREIVVESHGFLGVPGEEVRERLAAMGYEPTLVGAECDRRDIRVLRGVRRADS